MGTYGTGHWFLALIVWLVVFHNPNLAHRKQSRYAGTWSLITIVPLVNIIALWVFAFMRWPNERSQG